MQLNDLVAYTSMLVALSLAPGPIIALAISRGLSQDLSGAMAFVVGIAAGDALIIVLVCGGLGLWLQSYPTVFTLAKIASLTYLLYIAYGMWRDSEHQTVVGKSLRAPVYYSDVIAGMTMCIVSPQTILIYLMLLPGLVDITVVSPAMIGFIAMFSFFIITLAFATIVLMTCRLNSAGGSFRHKLILNRTLSLVICASGFWMVST